VRPIGFDRLLKLICLFKMRAEAMTTILPQVKMMS